MTRTLKHVDDVALELRAIGDDNEKKEEIGAITAEMEPLLGALGNAQAQLLSFLDEMKRETGELTAGIEKIAKGISAHNRANDVVDAVIKGLQQVEALRKRATGMESGMDAGRLDKLASRYTMHQERIIHRAHLERIHGTAPMAEEKEFADNVELF